MNKEEKTRIITGLQDKFTRATGVIFTDYKGLTVEEISDLRKKLRDGSFEYRVVKNTLAKRASEGTQVEATKDSFAGPVGIAIGFDDPALLAKKVIEFAKGNEKLEIRGGVIEGQICEADTIKAISELPSRETLLSTIVGTMQSPLSKFASALNATMSQFAFAMMALRDKKSN